jgi:type II secretion system protein G
VRLRLVGMRHFAAILLWTVAAGTSCQPIRSDRARERAFEKQIEQLMTAVEAYRRDVGRYPSEAQGLAALWRDTAPGWRGPYLLREPPLDPWGKPYLYRLRPDGTAQITRR